MRSANTESIVLKNINYKESDRVYTLFTKEFGKVPAIAKGVRKISSKRSGSLDTLNLISVKLSKTNSAFYSIDEVRVINSFKNIKSNYDVLTKAYYLLEFIHKVIEENHHFEDLFNVLRKSLLLLNTPGISPVLSVSYFEIQYLRFSGYQLGLHNCIYCGRKYDSTWEESYFSFPLGGLVCPACAQKGLVGGVTKIECAPILHKLSLDVFPTNATLDQIREVDRIVKSFLSQTLDTKFKSLEI